MPRTSNILTGRNTSRSVKLARGSEYNSDGSVKIYNKYIQIPTIGLNSDPIIGEANIVRKSISDTEDRVNSLLELAHDLVGGSIAASEAHTERVENAARALDSFGIKAKLSSRVLAEILALALGYEPVVAELKPGDKPLFRDRRFDAVHPERATYDIVQWLRTFWREETAPESSGLSRPLLRHIDPSADQAVSNWLRSRPLPADIKLMTKREINDLQTQQLDPNSMRENERIRGILRRRRSRMKRPDV